MSFEILILIVAIGFYSIGKLLVKLIKNTEHVHHLLSEISTEIEILDIKRKKTRLEEVQDKIDEVVKAAEQNK